MIWKDSSPRKLTMLMRCVVGPKRCMVTSFAMQNAASPHCLPLEFAKLRAPCLLPNAFIAWLRVARTVTWRVYLVVDCVIYMFACLCLCLCVCWFGCAQAVMHKQGLRTVGATVSKTLCIRRLVARGAPEVPGPTVPQSWSSQLVAHGGANAALQQASPPQQWPAHNNPTNRHQRRTS